MAYDTAQPYIASFVIIRDKDSRIAFVLRANTSWMNGFYGLPSGKVEKEEPFSLAAIRELKEEVGVDVTMSNLKYIHTMHRREPDSPHSDWLDVYFEAEKYAGEPYNAEPEVHKELSWFYESELPKNIIPSVAFAIKRIAEGKKYSEFGFGD